jgi:mersacidin/lichenicidin family type 2 lantibiotic
MNTIVRAWKDETYRQSLSVEEQTMLPANPAGEIELTDAALEGVHGAWDCRQHQSREINSGDSGDGSNNTITQDVNQSAAATFGNKNLVIDSFVWCSAENHADLDAKIKNKNFDI